MSLSSVIRGSCAVHTPTMTAISHRTERAGVWGQTRGRRFLNAFFSFFSYFLRRCFQPSAEKPNVRAINGFRSFYFFNFFLFFSTQFFAGRLFVFFFRDVFRARASVQDRRVAANDRRASRSKRQQNNNYNNNSVS